MEKSRTVTYVCKTHKATRGVQYPGSLQRGSATFLIFDVVPDSGLLLVPGLNPPNSEMEHPKNAGACIFTQMPF